MKLRTAARSCALLAAALLASLAAHGQLFRAYVSASGNDSNPCTLPQPCRLLPAALAAVQAGGEIWMLDSANYNTSPVNVTQSVSILAVPGVVGSVVATSLDYAIGVNGQGIDVSLRNLVVVRLDNGQEGIRFIQGNSLVVAGCEIFSLPGFAIDANAPGGTLTVTDTVIHNAGGGISVANGTAMVDRTRIAGGGLYGVVAGSGGKVTVTDSLILGAQLGVAASTSGGSASLTVERTRVSGATIAVFARTEAAADNAQVAVSRSFLTQSTTAGIATQQAPSSTVTVVADEVVVSGNAVGFDFLSGGAIYTRNNNTLQYNGSDISGGSLTALAGS
jgi:hypothetical protein